MLAQRADKAFGQGIALVNITADGADPALLFGSLGLGLDVGVVILIGAGGGVAQHLSVRYLGEEQGVAAQINALYHRGGHGHIGAAGEMIQAVLTPGLVGEVGELVHVAARLHAEVLEQGEVSLGGDAADGEAAGAENHVMGIIALGHGNGNADGIVGHLRDRVDDTAVVLTVFLRGQEEQTISQFEQSFLIHKNTSFKK